MRYQITDLQHCTIHGLCNMFLSVSKAHQKEILAGAFGYSIWWFFVAARKTRIRAGTCHSFLTRVIAQCPTLHATYYPTFFAPTAFLQLVVAGVRELLFGWLPFTRSPYHHRDHFELPDGQVVALDWMLPTDRTMDPAAKFPVAILCHGAFQSSHSAPMINIAQSIVQRLGFPVVVFNRRGYEVPLTIPRTDFYGSDEDMDEVVSHVAERYPQHPVCFVGFSCGGMFVVRYLSHRTNKYINGAPAKKKQSLEHVPTAVKIPLALAATTRSPEDSAATNRVDDSPSVGAFSSTPVEELADSSSSLIDDEPVTLTTVDGVEGQGRVGADLGEQGGDARVTWKPVDEGLEAIPGTALAAKAHCNGHTAISSAGSSVSDSQSGASRMYRSSSSPDNNAIWQALNQALGGGLEEEEQEVEEDLDTSSEIQCSEKSASEGDARSREGEGSPLLPAPESSAHLALHGESAEDNAGTVSNSLSSSSSSSPSGSRLATLTIEGGALAGRCVGPGGQVPISPECPPPPLPVATSREEEPAHGAGRSTSGVGEGDPAATSTKRAGNEPPPLPVILGGVSLDYGWHGGDDGMVSRTAPVVREVIACFIWVQYVWRHTRLFRAHGLHPRAESTKSGGGNDDSAKAEGHDAGHDEGDTDSEEEDVADSAHGRSAVDEERPLSPRGRAVLRAPPELPFSSELATDAGAGGMRSLWSALWKGRSAVYMFQRAREVSVSFRHRRRNVRAGINSVYEAWFSVCQPRLNQVGVPLLLINSRDDPVLVWENAEPRFLEQADSNEFVARWELRRGGHGTKSTGLFGLFPCMDLAPRAIAEFLAALHRERTLQSGGLPEKTLLK